MTRLSISTAWDETRRFLLREQKVLLPIVLALLVLPPVASAMIAPPTMAGGLPTPGPWMLVVIVTFVLRLFGLLAVTRLAIGAAGSVGQALRDVAKRIPAVAGLTALVALPAMLIATPLLAPMLTARTTPAPGPAFGLLLLMLALLVLFVRLSLSLGVAASGPGGPIAIARRSIALTRGTFWRLLAAIVLMLITLAILSRVVQQVVGSLLIVTLGKPAPFSVSLLLLLLALQLIDAAVTVVLTVLLARSYAQRAGDEAVPRLAD